MNKQADDIAIRLTDVTKQYIIHHEKPTLAERVIHGVNERFLALDAVSLTVRKGEKVGIVGLNGSGKTTLLKTIAGITCPTHGTVYARGKIISLIDLEAGFESDLTGEQNIFLNGMIIGMSTAEIKRNLTKIIAFADIHQFIDTPLYTYSQGMKLRLGFSIAIHSKPEILMLDEGMGVGDRLFYYKAVKKINELFRQNKTVIMASHDLEFIYQNCSRYIIMKQGKIYRDFPSSAVSFKTFAALFRQSGRP